jgi:hypothetical protein
MSDLAAGPCSDVCVLNRNDDNEAEFYDVTLPKARKTHQCTECGNAIQPGENYERTSAKWDGDLSTFKTCLLCVEIRNKFACGRGWSFGCVWEDLREYLFDHLTFGCLDGLSPAAREKVLDAWRKWKGLAA